MTIANPFELVRPLVWIAALAFLIGFGGYLAAAGAGRPTQIDAPTIAAGVADGQDV